MIKLLIVLTLSPLWASSDNSRHQSPERVNVMKMTRPVRLLGIRKIPNYVNLSPEGQLSIPQFCMLLMEIKHGNHIEEGPVIIQYHPQYGLFTMRSDKIVEINIIDVNEIDENKVTEWKSKRLIGKTLEEIIRAFDY